MKYTKIILFIFVVLIMIYIETSYTPGTKRVGNNNFTLPSCRNCKIKLNDFCKKDPTCIGDDCQIDDICRESIRYSCTHTDFDCNPESCRDWYELQDNPYWGCNSKGNSN